MKNIQIFGGNVKKFKVTDLFKNGEQGVWYDPSDISSYMATGNVTMYQDATGITPVDGVEQPVGLILDKSRGLALGPNLYAGGTIVGVPVGGPAFTNYPLGFSVVAGKTYRVSIDVTGYSGTNTYSVGGVTGTDWVVLNPQSGNRKWEFTLMALSSTAFALFTRSTNTATFSNISVREISGIPAYQTTAIDRPILRRGIQNIQLHSNTYSNVYWTLNNCTQSIATGEFIDGVQATRLEITANGNSTFVNSGNISIASGITYTMSSYVRQGTARYVQLTLPGAVFGVGQYANFDLQTGTITYSIGGTASILAVTGGYIISWSAVATSSASAGIGAVIIVNGPTSTRLETAIALAGQTIFIATTGVFVGAYTAYDIENKFGGIPITTSTTANTTLGERYLSANGTNTSMRTNNINFSTTDEVNIFTGVRKLSDANVGMIVELSINSAANSGTFSLRGPQNPGGSGDFAFGTGGSNPTAALPNSAIQAPVSRVVTGIGKISADTAILRLNNIQVATSTADQSTGNYGTYPIFLFRRGGTSVPFNGNLYGLIIRGKLSTDKQIREIEKYFNKKILG